MSTKLMTALSECPIDLGATVGLNTVCIDNQDVRKRLLKNGKIEISAVPCVLIVYRTGGVEKYEGKAAFQWFDEAVSKYSPAPQLSEQPPIQPTPQPQAPNPPQPQRKEVREVRRPAMEEESDEDDEIEYIPAPEPPRKTKTARKSKKETTSIDDLGFEPFEEIDDSIKNSIKGKDLLSAAAAMQKERDVVDSNKTKRKHST